MTLIQAYKDRRLVRDLTIQDANGDTITPGMNDKIRVIIGRTYQTPLLTIISGTVTANGSSLTKGATNRLTIASADLEALKAGIYSLFFDFFDNADNFNSDDWKKIENQVFSLEESP